MDINYRKKELIYETPRKTKKCPNKACNSAHPDNYYLDEGDNFCIYCGRKLVLTSSMKVYANFGNNGFKTLTFKVGNMTINSSGRFTYSAGNGISFTQKL